MEGRKRNRMQGFDYSSDAIYFVTICTHDKIHQFGKIQDEKMNLNEFGTIADHQICWLKRQYSYVELHNFVVMPNHVHLLIGINRDFENTIVGEIQRVKIKSISSLIGAYKTTVSKQIHELGNKEFAWQRSFYDHMVRNKKKDTIKLKTTL